MENPKPSSSERMAVRTRFLEPTSPESNDSTSRRSSRSPTQFSSNSAARCLGSHSEARWNSSSICAQRSGVKDHLSSLHFALQPGFRHLQVSPDCHQRDFESSCSFFQRQSAKIVKLH